MPDSLPASSDAEKFVLGSILLDEHLYAQAAAELVPEDFALDKHRRIFNRMGELFEWEEHIDRITIANELLKHNELEACDGLSYIVSLDDGIPQIPNIDSYVRIVKSKSTLRRLMAVGESLVNRARLQDETPEAIVTSLEEQLLNLAPRSRIEASTPEDILANYPGGISQFMNPALRPPGLATGFCDIDRMTCGMHGGDLIIVGGRPSMGKTAWATNVATHVAVRCRQRVVIFSLEMSKESLLERMMCAQGRVNTQRFRHGDLDREERDRLEAARTELCESPLLIDDSSELTVTEMRSKVARIIRRSGPVALVVIDYLQLMTSKGKTENRTQEISGLSRSAKLMAKALNLPVLVLSQLSRACEQRKGDHRPMLSDLRESGSLEQDADIVGLLYRPEVYDRSKGELHGKAEFILGKQRQGPTGVVNLTWLAAHGRFENRAEERLYPDAEE